MKIQKLRIHNFRSIIDVKILFEDLLLLVGSNNSGKSNIINSIRCFYEDIKWSQEDFPKIGARDNESWVEITFDLSGDEWTNLADKYKENVEKNILILRRYFKGQKVKARQSNIFAIVNGVEETELFYGAKNISTAKCGQIIYIPALAMPNEQMKMTGPSPLRNMLNFMLKKVIEKSPAYQDLGVAFESLNKEAKAENGFLSEVADPINNALAQWDVKMDFTVNKISPDEISKLLIGHSFIDGLLDDEGLNLDRFGHGFQRSVIYELIRIAPSFKDQKVPSKKEYDPDFTLILFEEPEAFLHPSQQENMSYHLRRLADEVNHQIVLTSHSPIFVGKSSDKLNQICRIQKVNGLTSIYQLDMALYRELIESGNDFLNVIQQYVDDPHVEGDFKIKANKLIAAAPADEDQSSHEKFRFQLWIDSDRASMFFADKVVLVEGATEKALFNYLLANDWHELTAEKIYVVDAFGKYNFHRFLKLFESFGISHGVMFDNDDNKNEHVVINKLIRDKCNSFTLAPPFEFEVCLEKHLSLNIPGRQDQKPLEILKSMENNLISDESLTELKRCFCIALSIT